MASKTCITQSDRKFLPFQKGHISRYVPLHTTQRIFDGSDVHCTPACMRVPSARGTVPKCHCLWTGGTLPCGVATQPNAQVDSLFGTKARL